LRLFLCSVAMWGPAVSLNDEYVKATVVAGAYTD
jgi:hypothetical protein